jgi:hypothetical protein
MDPIVKLVTEKFAAFEHEQDPTRIVEALDALEAAERDLPLSDAEASARAVSRRLGFFEALDRTLDPRWDAQHAPPRGVAPPPSHHGAVFSSGEVDPAAIADPQERARYVQALRDNKDQNRRYSVQDQLRRVDERAMRFFGRLLIDRYGGSPAGQREFEHLLAAAPLGGRRRERLRALLQASA